MLEWVAISFSSYLPNPEIEPRSPALQVDLYQLSHKGSPRILEWVACPFPSRSSQPRNQPRVTCVAGGFLMSWATREALKLATKFKWVQPILWIVLVLWFRSAQSRMVAASHMWLFKIKFKLNMTKFWFPCRHISCAYQSFVARGYCRGHLR